MKSFHAFLVRVQNTMRLSLSDLRTGTVYKVVANAGYFSKLLTLESVRDGLYTFRSTAHSATHIVTRYDIEDGHVQMYAL